MDFEMNQNQQQKFAEGRLNLDDIKQQLPKDIPQPKEQVPTP